MPKLCSRLFNKVDVPAPRQAVEANDLGLELHLRNVADSGHLRLFLNCAPPLLRDESAMIQWQWTDLMYYPFAFTGVSKFPKITPAVQ